MKEGLWWNMSLNKRQHLMDDDNDWRQILMEDDIDGGRPDGRGPLMEENL